MVPGFAFSLLLIVSFAYTPAHRLPVSFLWPVSLLKMATKKIVLNREHRVMGLFWLVNVIDIVHWKRFGITIFSDKNKKSFKYNFAKQQDDLSSYYFTILFEKLKNGPPSSSPIIVWFLEVFFFFTFNVSPFLGSLYSYYRTPLKK